MVVDLCQLPIFRKIWTVVLIASMLSLQLASIYKESAVTPYEDALFEISEWVNDDGTAEDCLLKTEPELSFNVELVPAEELSLPGGRLKSSVKPALAALSLKDIISEIFTPPRSVS